jgi:hypothetical protein
MKKCFRPGGKCKNKTYNPSVPASLPDVIGDRKKPNIICHHVPTPIGNPVVPPPQ